MAGTATYPGSHNVFVPDWDASGRLRVDFSRNVKDFGINSYAQIVPVTKPIGYFMQVTVEEAGRLIDATGNRFAWPDGAERPDGEDGTEKFDWAQYYCNRRSFPVTLGNMTVENADWDIKAQHAAIKAQQAMTFRTQVAITQFQTSGNYAANHTSSVAGISGNSGTWTASTTQRQDIKRSLNYAAEQIMLDTLNAVKLNDLILVVSPLDAANMAVSQEIVDHIKGSPEALAQIRGDLPGRNVAFGLPDKLYGFPVIVEATVKVTTRKGASSTSRSFVMGQGSPFMCSRPGGLVGLYGAPSFSTGTFFMLEEMTTEWLNDAKNRRTLGSVVENFDFQMTAPVSGFLFTSAT